MRLGLLSDIHGNAAALEAVLVDAAGRQVDRWLNLGDSYYGPLEPSRTADLLASVDVMTIQGNQDRQLYESSTADIASNPTLHHVLAELGQERVADLRKLPSNLALENSIFACHGSVESDSHYLLEDVSSGFPRVRAEAELEAQLRGIDAKMVVCGHSHLPRIVRLRSGTFIVNPGSVGLPAYSDDAPNYHEMETYSPNAAYAIVSRCAFGWSVELHSVPYDSEGAAQRAADAGRRDWAQWLRTGRCGRPT